MSKYNHYFKDVSHLVAIDVYRVIQLFEVNDEPISHAVKKLLCAGDRGIKDKVTDVKQAIDSLNRFLQMVEEDGKKKSNSPDCAIWERSN